MTPTCSSASTAEIAPGTGGGWISTRAQIALTACACGGATAFLFAVDPSRHAVYPQCLLYNATGIYCAGCGATRALYALLHGRLLVALHDNALFIAALPLILYVAGAYDLDAGGPTDVEPELSPAPTATKGFLAVLGHFLGLGRV